MKNLRIEIPLDWQLSKNRRIQKNRRTGQTIYNANKAVIDGLRDIIFYESQSKKLSWEKKKTWIKIMVHKKNYRGDISNFVDGIADAVKKAILVDDCWFAFILDYEIKADQKIIIEISQ